MTSPRARPARRPPLVLLAFLLVALCAGLAATFLAAPAGSGGATSSTGAPPTPISTSTLGWILTGVALVPLLGLVLNRLLSRNQATSYRPFVNFLIAVLLSVTFIAIVRTLPWHPATADSSGAPPPGSTGGPGTNLTNQTVGPSPLGTTWPGIPTVWLYVALAVVVLAVVLLATPRLLRREEGPAPEPDANGALRRSFRDALRGLEAGAAGDARRTVLILYGRLLERIAPRLDALEPATPREIEQACVERLGLGAAHARSLTRLFEEARYSSHPFTSTEVDVARAALSACLGDLDRRARGI